MDPTTLAHAGGLDELAIILFPVLVGFGVWILTRQANPPKKSPAPRVDPAQSRTWTHPADQSH